MRFLSSMVGNLRHLDRILAKELHKVTCLIEVQETQNDKERKKLRQITTQITPKNRRHTHHDNTSSEKHSKAYKVCS